MSKRENNQLGFELDTLITNLSEMVAGLNRDRSYNLAAKTQMLVVQLNDYRDSAKGWLSTPVVDIKNLPTVKDEY